MRQSELLPHCVVVEQAGSVQRLRGGGGGLGRDLGDEEEPCAQGCSPSCKLLSRCPE